MKTYYDTSLLVKLYVPEPDSGSINEFVRSEGKAIPLNVLHEAELRNALALKAFRQEITKDDLTQVLRKIERDIDIGRLVRARLNWDDLVRTTVELSMMYTPEIGCRTMDILHVAAAAVLGCERFVSNDARQRHLAERLGMVTNWT